jgi:thiol-disulfide isomerase/thioredoxin
MFKVVSTLGLLGVALAWAAAGAGAQDDAVTLNVVKYDGLKQEVLRHRGKVVVVDFWADFCVPCKKNMPHLVDLSRKLGGKDLAVITVAIDSLSDNPEVKDSLLKFLKKVNANFTNLLLDEPPSLFEQKLHFKSVPTVFVFDRRGQWVQFTDEVDPHKVEDLVVSMLKE